MADLQTDYLVVGAGASGMAFVDTLVGAADVDVVLVDRRAAPGGHWNDAYPFAQLHQPSAYYGVDSLPLGAGRVVEAGPEAGFHERATATEVRTHYEQALERLLATGRVRFLGMHDAVPGPRPTLVSRVTGRVTTVGARRRVVDATHLESSVPALHRPGFTRDPDARVIDPTGLVRLDAAPGGITVLGGGKTAMDTCMWLLEHGVDPEAIRWVRPRDPWVLDRGLYQPGDGIPRLVEGLAAQMEAAATATDAPDLLARLEGSGQLLRLDPAATPTAFRGAVLSAPERERLATIRDVVRLGRVLHVGADRLHLQHGDVLTEAGRLHVDCTASGLPVAPARPVFSAHRIVLQMIQTGVVPFSAAIIAHIEASGRDDVERNRLCPPNPAPSAATDWIRTTAVTQRAHALWRAEPDVAAWVRATRLNPLHGIEQHLGDPAMQTALGRLAPVLAPALENLDRLGALVDHGGRPSTRRRGAAA